MHLPGLTITASCIDVTLHVADSAFICHELVGLLAIAIGFGAGVMSRFRSSMCVGGNAEALPIADEFLEWESWNGAVGVKRWQKA